MRKLHTIDDIKQIFSEQLEFWDQNQYSIHFDELAMIIAKYFRDKWHSDGWRYGSEMPEMSDSEWKELEEITREYEIQN